MKLQVSTQRAKFHYNIDAYGWWARSFSPFMPEQKLHVEIKATKLEAENKGGGKM